MEAVIFRPLWETIHSFARNLSGFHKDSEFKDFFLREVSQSSKVVASKERCINISDKKVELYDVSDFVFYSRTDTFDWNMASSVESEFCTRYEMKPMTKENDVKFNCSFSTAPEHIEASASDKVDVAAAPSQISRAK